MVRRDRTAELVATVQSEDVHRLKGEAIEPF